MDGKASTRVTQVKAEVLDRTQKKYHETSNIGKRVFCIFPSFIIACLSEIIFNHFFSFFILSPSFPSSVNCSQRTTSQVRRVLRFGNRFGKVFIFHSANSLNRFLQIFLNTNLYVHLAGNIPSLLLFCDQYF